MRVCHNRRLFSLLKYGERYLDDENFAENTLEVFENIWRLLKILQK